MWFAGEDENGTEVPMTLSLRTVRYFQSVR
jgi:hypothetical protein